MRIDGKVDKLLICQEDHETRIRILQDRQMNWLGRDGVIAGSLGVAGGSLIAAALWVVGVGR
jgi:hypothetical protein